MCGCVFHGFVLCVFGVLMLFCVWCVVVVRLCLVWCVIVCVVTDVVFAAVVRACSCL